MNKFSYIWTIDKCEGNETARLKFRITWNSSKSHATFSLGRKVFVNKWIQEAQRCKPSSMQPNGISASTITTEMLKYETAADKLFDRYYNEGKIPSKFDMRLDFESMIGNGQRKEESSLLVNCIYKYISDSTIQGNIVWNTQKGITTLQTLIREYDKNFSIDDISKNKMIDFQSFLIRKEYNNSYIRKLMKAFYTFIGWLRDNDLYTGDVLTKKRLRFKGIDDNHVIVYLTWEELQKIYTMDVESVEQGYARDVFCFCCFTSLRYSDVSKLQKADIRDDKIYVVTQKTVESLTIELNDYSRAILNKYKDVRLPRDLALPVVSNQRMNEHLKRIAKNAGLTDKIKKVYFSGNVRHESVHEKWELLTTHCGRRTFIVNALYLGIPAEVVMKWTGHADYKAMKPYIVIVDRLKSREMDKFNTIVPDFERN